jgi:cytochrome b6-f complex iron-sulfur subunit
MTQTRRTFCIHACELVAVGSLGALLPGCGGSSTSPSSAPELTVVNGSVGNGAVTVIVDSSSPLATVGGAARVQSSAGGFLVTRTAQDACSAVTAVCTHEGCTVSGFENQAFVCPCHGSQFNSSGAVLKGPAASPLRRFSTTFTNNVLTIAV